jgi:hypothetical protein
MSVDPVAASAARVDTERAVLALKKHQDVAKAVGQSLVDLVKAAPSPAPGRIDTYA